MNNIKRQRRLERQSLIRDSWIVVLVGALLIGICIVAAIHDQADQKAACAASNACLETGR